MNRCYSSLREISLPLLLTAALGAASLVWTHGTPVNAAEQVVSQPQQAATFHTLTPDWEKTIRKPKYGVDEEVSTYANGRVYYKLKEKIAATEVTSGKTKWTVPVTMAAPPTADTTSLYVINKQNVLYRLDQKTGKTLWKSSIPHLNIKKKSIPQNIRIQENLVITGDSAALTAFDRTSGKLKWQNHTTSKAGYYVEQSSSSIIIATPGRSIYEHSIPLYALDSKNGRLLWKTTAKYEKVLTIQNGYIYSQKYTSSKSKSDTVHIDKLDLQTGQPVQTFNYSIKNDSRFGWSFNVDYYDGDFYIRTTINYDDRQWGLFRIPLDAPSGSKPAASYSFYTPIYRVDFSKDVLAVALMDENVYFLNRQNGQRLGVSLFESNFFNATLNAETHFLIQTAGKISAVKIPENSPIDK
ncbi:outer membrane protein assembly factor BamB family protein [Paenibacillus sp. Z6-24]